MAKLDYSVLIHNTRLDLPTAVEICGADNYYGWDSGKLKIFKKTGKTSVATDFVFCLDCLKWGSLDTRALKYFSNNNGVCEVYTKTAGYNSVDPIIIDCCGSKKYGRIDHSTSIAVRPVIRNFSSLGIDISNAKRLARDVKVIEYGMYPQDLASEEVASRLSDWEKRNKLVKTGRKYTGKVKKITGGYEYVDFYEYKYDDISSCDKYVKMIYHGFYNCHPSCRNGQVLWFYVKPIEWFIDEKSDTLISRYALTAFPNFTYANQLYHGDYEHTEIYDFLNNTMTPQIFGNAADDIQVQEEEKTPDYNYNPYNFNFNKVSNDDIISGALDAGLTVFLHGASGVGKSARVLEMDEDAEIVYVCNESRDGFMGKSVYNPEKDMMKDVPPVWYTNLVEKCNREQNKMHILFLDELTMADIYVQKMVFNLILSRRLDGKWKLPDNARIITAGNETKDSMAANPIVEPLFGRLVHVYIEDSLSSWLSWASMHNIHPAIYAYVAYTNGRVLRTTYTGIKPNADPRRWEMASKMLYATGNPETLVSVVGEDLTKEFIGFCKTKVITLEDVLNGNYSSDVVASQNLSEKYATAMSLSCVQEEDFMKVREFVSLMGAEFVALFDSIWAHGNDDRLELISQIKMKDNIKKRTLE